MLTVFETRQNNVAVPAIDPVTGLPTGPLPDGTEPSMAYSASITYRF